MDPQAQVFATKGTYQYYTRYYDMLNKMNETRRANTLANINKSVEDPMKFRQKRQMGSLYVGPVNTVLGAGLWCACVFGCATLCI